MNEEPTVERHIFVDRGFLFDILGVRIFMLPEQVDAFWEFMIEREQIRLRRKEGLPRAEWTKNRIMSEYSFTNVKRIYDRTTHLFVEEYYNAHHDCTHPSIEALLNAAIFRYHGTIETARALGWHKEWSPPAWERMIEVNETRSMNGERIFTSAYIIPACGDSRPKQYVVAEIINGIWTDSLTILSTTLWQKACDLLSLCWGVGSFMAKEVLLDYILITGWQPEDWFDWTPVGPGARRGASIIKYGISRKIPEWEALEIIKELYVMAPLRWPPKFEPLDLTDIQFQSCEFDKYMRAVLGGRPKRRFYPTIDTITGPQL